MHLKRIKLRRKFIIFNPRDVFLSIVLLIFLGSLFIIIKFNKIVTPNLLSIVNIKLDNMVSIIINKSFDKEIVGENLGDILLLDMSGNEINGVSFNMEKIYEMARGLTTKFNENITYIENGQWDKIGYEDIDAIKNEHGYVLAFPVGIVSKSIFIANLGPKIPVKIKLVGTTLNTVETKITEYGINNALVEIYIDMNIERQIITPIVFEKKQINYKFLVGSKVINGKVPLFYNGLLTKGTNINIPIS